MNTRVNECWVWGNPIRVQDTIETQGRVKTKGWTGAHNLHHTTEGWASFSSLQNWGDALASLKLTNSVGSNTELLPGSLAPYAEGLLVDCWRGSRLRGNRCTPVPHLCSLHTLCRTCEHFSQKHSAQGSSFTQKTPACQLMNFYNSTHVPSSLHNE